MKLSDMPNINKAIDERQLTLRFLEAIDAPNFELKLYYRKRTGDDHREYKLSAKLLNFVRMAMREEAQVVFEQKNKILMGLGVELED